MAQQGPWIAPNSTLPDRGPSQDSIPTTAWHFYPHNVSPTPSRTALAPTSPGHPCRSWQRLQRHKPRVGPDMPVSCRALCLFSRAKTPMARGAISPVFVYGVSFDRTTYHWMSLDGRRLPLDSAATMGHWAPQVHDTMPRGNRSTDLPRRFNHSVD